MDMTCVVSVPEASSKQIFESVVEMLYEAGIFTMEEKIHIKNVIDREMGQVI